MKIRRRREFACGVLFGAVGLAFAWAAGTWPLGREAAPGPGLLGLGLALALTTLSGLVLFMATTIESPNEDPFVPLPARSTVLVLAALLVFGLLLPRAGLVLTVAAGTLLARLAWPLLPGASASGRATRRRATGHTPAWRALWRAVRLHGRAWLAALLVQPAAAGAAAWLVCHGLLQLHLPLWPRPLATWLAS
jgi:hypothetical protein